MTLSSLEAAQTPDVREVRDTAARAADPIDPLAALLGDLAIAPVHASQLRRNWLTGRALDAGHRPATHFFPQRLRDAMPQLRARLAGLAHVVSEHPAQDGSVRLLVALGDGQTVESVLLPREGVCVSTQVGCAVGCTFCMTGREGLLRQLSCAEILAQVALARTRRPVRKVVFMGMGEPAHNLEAVLQTIALLGTEGGIGHKNLVFSTVGDRRVFDRLPRERVRPALALSLHTTRDELRAQLLPRAPRIAPQELIELGEAYARTGGYPIQYQWTLIAGVNDTDEEVTTLARLLAGKSAVMNFIPVNAVPDSDFARPPAHRAIEMVRALRAQGVLATLRDSAGQDVEGGCGQLRARALGEQPITFDRRNGSLR
jgi:23S rRNA (adenine2503-C2)-methyltransferase